jgi:hypothetical protein
MMAAAPPRTRGTVLVPLAIVTLLAATFLPALLRPHQFIQEDSYFYLQIAHHIAAGHGSTFHGITPTNGYHPLWMACVVALMALAGGNKATGLYYVVILQMLLTVATLLLFRRLAPAIALEFWLPGLAVLALYLLGTSLYGSEAHLNALTLVAATLSLWRTMSSQQDRMWLWTGVLFGLAVLARLDNVFVAAGLLGFGVLHERPRDFTRSARRAALAALGGAAVVAPYLAYNVLSYGHLVPITGAIKSQLPVVTFDLGRLGAMGMLVAPFGLVCLAIGLFADNDRRRRVVWLGLGSGVLLHALYVVAATDHYTFWPWYYVSGAVAASLAAAYLTGPVVAVIRPVIGQTAASVLVLTATFVLLAGASVRACLKAFSPFRLGPIAVNVRINAYRWPEELAVWMKANIPRGSIVYVQDWPGAIAYYSDLRILPMDGLLNDYQYNDELLALGVESYLCSRGVKYFMGHLIDRHEPHEVPVSVPLYRQPAGVLTLQPEDIVIETRTVLKQPDDAPPYAIWRVPCPSS